MKFNTSNMTKRLARLALILLIVGSVTGIGQLLRNETYYPLVVVDAADNLTLTFLQRPTPDSNACSVLAANIASLMHANCPGCTVTRQQCTADLTTDLTELLSERPVPLPSARILNGVIAYAHPDPKTALAICLESQRQSIASEKQAQVLCDPANTPRPLPSSYNKTAEATQAAFHYFAQFVSVFAACLGIYLIIQFFSVRNPTDTLGTPAATVVDLKITNLIKRIADILISLLLLSALIPILVLVSALIFVLEGYPIFYVSKRFISLDQCVSILKFRTMVKDATSPKYRLRERFMRDGYLDIPLNCEVYTPIGRFLERTQLVEVLQLFNILFHGMSLIGNRPLPRENIMLLKQFPGWEGRFFSPAGLTGLSQVVGKLNQTPLQRMELECLYSSTYKEKGGNILLCDLFIAYFTVRLLFFGKPLSFDGAKRLIMSANGK